MRINIEYGYINEKTLKEDLINFGQFDHDANGANGEKYLDDTAREKGYKNNLEYWSDIALEVYKSGATIEKAIDVFMIYFATSWMSCCNIVDYKVSDENNSKLLIFVYC